MLFEQAQSELELIIRHIEILTEVANSGPVGILKLSELTGMQPHKVRYSLRILEQNNLIEPTRQGAILGDNVSKFIESSDLEYEKLAELIQDIKKSEKKMIEAFKQNSDESEF